MRGRFTGKAGVVASDISGSVHAIHLRAVMGMTDCRTFVIIYILRAYFKVLDSI